MDDQAAPTTAAQLAALVDRILRLKEERKALNDDIRDVYAEAKANGYDKTVLGKLVSYVVKREDDGSALKEAEALFETYLSAYDSAKANEPHTHARARAA